MADKTLRKRLIRLAHKRPDLRPQLLPLLAKQAAVNVGSVRAMEDAAHEFWDGIFNKADLPVEDTYFSKYGFRANVSEESWSDYEPSQTYGVDWELHVNWIKGTLVAKDKKGRALMGIKLEVWNASDGELVKAIRRVRQKVPMNDPHMPDTPSLQDRGYPYPM